MRCDSGAERLAVGGGGNVSITWKNSKSVMRLKRYTVERASDAGFTIVEMLVYLSLSIVLISGVYQLLVSQNRLYSKQRELEDVRATLRSAAAVLAVELRMASPAGGDISGLLPHSIVVRSLQGAGFVCGIHPSAPRLGLTSTYGEFFDTADDSVMIYSAGGASANDDSWMVTGVINLWEGGGGGGVPNCTWGSTTEVVVEVDTLDGSVLPGVNIGAPLRTFRRVEYGLFQKDGRWWLGRKVGSATEYDRLTGPLQSPSDSGLAFYYYDQNGAVTADPTAVRMVEILLRGESLKAVRRVSGAPSVQQDTLRTRVTLRGG